MTTSSKAIFAIIPAAGIGSRMQSSLPKQYLTINGKAILEHTLERFLNHPQIEQVIVPLHQDDVWFEHLAVAKHPKLQAILGGQERSDSVLAGLQAIEWPQSPFVLVHDAARPCITQQDINKLIDAARKHEDGAILAMPVRDTMKRSDSNNCIAQTVDRSQLWHALTPQIFDKEQLQQAIIETQRLGINITDEASAIEALGGKVQLIGGSFDNIKVTHPQDLQIAKLFMQAQEQAL
ncbi:2-C-methyl-D-erythritol 4-phosphate cytidylyltransferase [Paraferrimonas sp. SM1919]|uniref:2-C-methyl-D-erythritol 4-phosphate cytidylyltransferase n=1 Tax=Paraferrimonas sp. SM1919 TaxID=2662263 RepID=UPI0013D88F2A|nr:2-C-methyl-D-erythritol 4-phosphate cytidylyltransferase [Paraferrimonas sp. SM1919]